MCCQIMAVPPDVLQSKPQDESGNTWKYPPTALVYMARDEHTARGVGEMTKALAEQVGGASTLSLMYLTTQCSTTQDSMTQHSAVFVMQAACFTQTNIIHSDVPANGTRYTPFTKNSRLHEAHVRNMLSSCA